MASFTRNSCSAMTFSLNTLNRLPALNWYLSAVDDTTEPGSRQFFLAILSIKTFVHRFRRFSHAYLRLVQIRVRNLWIIIGQSSKCLLNGLFQLPRQFAKMDC